MYYSFWSLLPGLIEGFIVVFFAAFAAVFAWRAHPAAAFLIVFASFIVCCGACASGPRATMGQIPVGVVWESVLQGYMRPFDLAILVVSVVAQPIAIGLLLLASTILARRAVSASRAAPG